MLPNPLKDGVISENSSGIGSVTHSMVQARAVELAAIAGLSSDHASTYRLQARRELTGASDQEPEDVLLESAPETVRWAPVYGSTGTKVEVAPNEDEDEDGRSDNSRLVERGIAEASLEQSRLAVSTQDD